MTSQVSEGGEFELSATVSDESAYVFIQFSSGDEGKTHVRLNGSGFEASAQGMLQMAEALSDIGSALRKQVIQSVGGAQWLNGDGSVRNKPEKPRGFNPRPVGPQPEEKR